MNQVLNPVSFKVIKHRYCAHTVKILCSADKMLPLNLCASVGLLFNRVEYSQSEGFDKVTGHLSFNEGLRVVFGRRSFGEKHVPVHAGEAG